MAFLRLDSESCGVAVVHEASTHSKSHSGDPEDQKLVLTLSLGQEQFTALHDSLGEIRAKEGSELRTEFPKGWTIFWKIRSSESRFLVARPEVGQWVATLALSPTHLELIRANLVAGVSGALSLLEPVSRMSNIEVILQLQNGESS